MIPFESLEVQAIPEPNTGCLLWLGSTMPWGYGQVWDRELKRNVAAHRAAYESQNGEIASGLKILHRCDTPACINPDHLFVGTHADNMQDMRNKGRSWKGKAKHAKLSEDEVMEIYKDTRSNAEIADAYGCLTVTVSTIKTGKQWGRVTGKVYEQKRWIKNRRKGVPRCSVV